MGSLYDAMDQIVEKVAAQFPGTIGFYTPSQAAAFAIDQQCPCLSSGIDLSLSVLSVPTDCLAWLGRISPERVWRMRSEQRKSRTSPENHGQDKSYWQQICQDYPDAPLNT